MSVVALPLPERIECDRNGFPIGHRAAFIHAANLFREQVNELPDGIHYLNWPDAELIFDNVIRDYLRLLPRVK